MITLKKQCLIVIFSPSSPMIVILSEAKDLISRWLLIYFLYLHKESSKESALTAQFFC